MRLARLAYECGLDGVIASPYEARAAPTAFPAPLPYHDAWGYALQARVPPMTSAAWRPWSRHFSGAPIMW